MYNLWESLTRGENPNAQLQLNYCEMRLVASKQCKWSKEITQITKLSVSALNRKPTPWSVFSQKHKYFIHTSPYVQSYIISDFHCLARVEKHTCISYVTSVSSACKSNILIWALLQWMGSYCGSHSVCRLSCFRKSFIGSSQILHGSSPGVESNTPLNHNLHDFWDYCSLVINLLFSKPVS